MKKLFKTTLVLALTVFASASYASGIETFIHVIGDKMFSVHHNTTGTVELTIKDKYGKILHDEKSVKKEFVKAFNLETLPIGTYFLEVEDDLKISTYTVNVTSSGLEVDRENVEKVFKPSVVQKNKSVDVSMLKLSKKPLDLSIFDSNNELIHKDSLKGEIVNKRYNLSNLKGGVYTMVFKVGDKNFEKTINLN